jgi:hypothetical protein
VAHRGAYQVHRKGAIMKRHTFAIVGILAMVFPGPRPQVFVPDFEFHWMRVEVGETRTVKVTARSSGPNATFNPWTFISSTPDVALVEGKMDVPQVTRVAVTGLRPGRAGIFVRPFSDFEQVKIEVECGREDPIHADTPERAAVRGDTIRLRVLSPIAHRTTFAWYHGRTGDTSKPLNASGAEVDLVPATAGTHYAWVLATTPCSSSMAEFRIEVRMPKQRVVRR